MNFSHSVRAAREPRSPGIRSLVAICLIAPAIAAEIPAMLQEAGQSGQSQRTLDGISVSVTIKPAGESVEFHISIMAAN